MRAEPRREIEDVLNQSEDEDTDDGSPDPPIAAGQHRSANDDGRNGLEFPKNTGGWRGRSETRYINEGRYRDTQTLKNIGCNPDSVHIDRRIFSDSSIGTNRCAVAAKPGAPQHELTDSRQDCQGNDRIGDPK